MTTIQQQISKLRTRRRQAFAVLGDPDASYAQKRQAMKQIDYIDRVMKPLQKASGKTA